MCEDAVRVASFDEVFETSFHLGKEGEDGRRLSSPSDIADDPEGNLYVTDLLNHQIQKFSASGKYLRTFGSRGKGPGQFNYPTSLVISYRRDIIVTDRWNHRVQMLNPEGHPTSVFGSYGKASGDFNEPWGMAISQNGHILVADRGNHRVQVINQKGEFQYSFGKQGFDRHYYEGTEFKSGYVFECWHGAVSRFNTIESSFRETGYEIGNLEFPRWIGPYREDSLLVIDTSGTIHIARTEGSITGQIEADYSDEKGQFTPTASTVTALGTVLICDECRNEIVSIEPYSGRKTILTGVPYPVSNLKLLHSGKLALIHCWDNLVSICSPKVDL